MKTDKIIELLLKLAPLLRQLLSRKQTPSPEEQEQLRRKAEDSLLHRKVNAMSVSSQVPSPSGVLSKADAVKLLRTSAVVAVAAGLAHLIEGVPALDLGQYDSLVTPILIMVLESLRRLFDGPKV